MSTTTALSPPGAVIFVPQPSASINTLATSIGSPSSSSTYSLVTSTSQYVYGGQTLTAGEAVTVGTVTYSLSSDASGYQVVGGSTSTTVRVYQLLTVPFPPMKTVFTPPATCSGHSFIMTGPSAKIYTAQSSPDPCYPPGWETARSYYYSPGVCPYDHTVVTAAVYGVSTVATCCPFYFDLTVSDKFCERKTTTVDKDVGTTTFWGSVTPIMVAWQASDLSMFTPASAPLLEMQMAGPLPGATSKPPVPSPATGTQSASHNSSLGVAVHAGIRVGAAAAILALSGISWFIWRSRKQRRNQYNADEGEVVLLSENLRNSEENAGGGVGTCTKAELWVEPVQRDLWGLDIKHRAPAEANELLGDSIRAEMSPTTEKKGHQHEILGDSVRAEMVSASKKEGVEAKEVPGDSVRAELGSAIEEDRSDGPPWVHELP